jgi:Chitin synthase
VRPLTFLYFSSYSDTDSPDSLSNTCYNYFQLEPFLSTALAWRSCRRLESGFNSLRRYIRLSVISSCVIEEYAEPNADTLHNKNLFSLGEDRFLTTLLKKHFPTFKTKFCPDAAALTVAPKSRLILFSQRRRRINSKVHSLCEPCVGQLTRRLGDCLYLQERIRARRPDGGLSIFFCLTFQISGTQFLLPDVLVYG